MTRNAYETMWGHIKKVMTRSYLSELSPAQARLVNWKEIGIQDLTAHVFRHNYCTALCYQMIRNRNISIKKIARLMGDTEKMVMEVYSHIIEELENAEEAIEAAVNL